MGSRYVAPCKICGRGPSREMRLIATTQYLGAREWRLRVCRDCWRAWEALLDEGSTSQQDGMFGAGHGRKLFLW